MLRRVSSLDGEIVLSLAQAKAQCRVLHNSEDDLIRALRDAAVMHVERETGVILSPGTFAWEIECFPNEFPVRPVTALGTITYVAADGTDTSYEGARILNQRLLPAVDGEWPDNEGRVSVSLTAGLEDLSLVSDLLAAVRLLIAHYYANREAASPNALSDLPLGVRALIHNHLQVGH